MGEELGGCEAGIGLSRWVALSGPARAPFDREISGLIRVIHFCSAISSAFCYAAA